MNTAVLQTQLVSANSRLELVNRELDMLQTEHEALTDFIQGTQSLLEFLAKATQEESTLTIRDAIREILQQTQGQPMTSVDIAERISRMNVPTKARDLTKSVDATLLQMMNGGEAIERVAPRTWCWKELSEVDDEEAQIDFTLASADDLECT